jgi:hypothetical protein
MSGTLTVDAFSTQTINSSATYSSVTVDLGGTLIATGAGTVVTINNLSATALATLEAENGATIDLASVVGIAAANAYDIGNNGTFEAGSGLNVTLLSPFTFANSTTTTGTLILDQGLNISLLDGIAGFGKGDSIDLAGYQVTGLTYAQGALGAGTLTVHTTAGDQTLSFDAGSDLSQADFSYTGSDITFACFAAGTLVDVPSSRIPVEHLTVGDTVCVASGGTRTVKWIGFRHLDLTRFADPSMAHPIRIAAEAFGEGLPRRDLVVSPDHALFVDGKLIAARLLVNGTTIRREAACRAITYYHVELDAHDILLAEGLPAESYLDTGNRGIFENAGVVVDFSPDFGNVDDDAGRAAGSCAPFATDEASVRPVWERLAQRAAELGHAIPAPVATTVDPDLCLMMGNRKLRPISSENNRYVFMLPAVVGPLRLRSRSMVPAEQSPWIDDRRRLGVKIRQMTVRQGQDVRTVPVDHPIFGEGWWAVENDDRSIWRWTDGNAVLGAMPGRAILEIELAETSSAYPITAAAEAGDASRIAA